MIDLFSAFMSGLYQIFTWSTFSLMLVGIAIGFIVGILPGLGGPATIALMLPFIVKMNAVEAFAILLGMASVLGTTGDITSVLFGVPGEPTAAATILDGHPMAKKGEAGRALGAVLMSSLVGALFGAVVLALFIPIVRPLVLTFGSAELFMLAILGLTFIASLSGGTPLKALLGAGIGLFLATVGMDPQSGIQRFTFGKVFLWDGVGLVPITMGFFAIPEIIDLGIQRSSIAKEKVKKLGGVLEGVKDTFRHLWLVIRCSAIGTFCAIIPGMGPSVSQWLAYAQALQSSKDKSRFGKGAVEGVLGPGAANNSSMGGSLITTVAFGVPASVLMAILIGAFLIQGLVPGPDMLIPEAKGGHLSLTFSFVWIMVVSNIITVAACLVFLNQLVRITYIRGSVIIPLILLLVYLGTFAEKNAFPDIILMLFFGVLGWIMERLDWPRPPFILGLVLGNLAETRLFLAVQSYGASWLLRPAVIVIMAITVFGALYPVLRRKRSRKSKDGAVSSSPDAASSGKPLGTSFQLGRRFQPRSGCDLCLGPLAEQKIQLYGRVLSLGHRNSRAHLRSDPVRPRTDRPFSENRSERKGRGRYGPSSRSCEQAYGRRLRLDFRLVCRAYGSSVLLSGRLSAPSSSLKSESAKNGPLRWRLPLPSGPLSTLFLSGSSTCPFRKGRFSCG